MGRLVVVVLKFWERSAELSPYKPNLGRQGRCSRASLALRNQVNEQLGTETELTADRAAFMTFFTTWEGSGPTTCNQFQAQLWLIFIISGQKFAQEKESE
jgi:hypothetical protein